MRLVDLIPLSEIDFPTHKAFDTYNKQHKLRPDTKVNIAGKTTTAGQAAQKSANVKGTSVFGKDKGGDVFAKNDTKLKKVTDRDRQIVNKLKVVDNLDKEWEKDYAIYTKRKQTTKSPNGIAKLDKEFNVIDGYYRRERRKYKEEADDLQPSSIVFGKKTQKAVSDWFDKNKIPYEMRGGDEPELQFDSKNLPKDKVKELVQLAKHVQKKEKIGIEGDVDSTLFIKR